MATVSVYNPQVKPHQYSSAAISVEAGNGADFNQIQIGWTVSIKLEKLFDNYLVSTIVYLMISYFFYIYIYIYIINWIAFIIII